jgi:DNA-binding LytR/AlgR family response regulator
MKIKCLVVDDEPLAREVLLQFIANCPSLEVVGECSDAIEAGEFLRSGQADLIFLDIEMPMLLGTDFIKTLTHPPIIIFTTAYPEFAAEGFDSNAVDYLLKPISFERFTKAVNKASEWLEFKRTKQLKEGQETPADPGFILLRADKRLYKTNYDDIFYLEATGDYIKVHTRERKLVIHETFRNILAVLPDRMFIRVHKSFIVSLDKISMIEGNQVAVAGQMIPVGQVFRDGLLAKLNIKNQTPPIK